MSAVWWAFHALLAALDGLALWAIRREPRSTPIAAVLWWFGVSTLALFGFQSSGGDLFALMAVLGFGLFVHGPVVLASTAFLLEGKARALFGACAGLISLVGIYAYQVEPIWIEVTEHHVVVPDAPRALTIAVLSDVQTDAISGHEARAVRHALAAEADLILFPGDLVQHADEDDYAETRAELNALFRMEGLSAPLGVYAVDGNVDVTRPWTPIFDGLDAQAVEGDIAHFEPETGIHITAIPFFHGFNTKLVIDDHPGLHIAFAHGPDFALGEIDADILVAGHTHGGQVQLPFFGPLITFSHVPKSWAAGRTDLDDQTLFVSRGVGMERHNAPRLRFGCRPEVMILRITPQ
ncbi:MAG: metallophosphoesterase family protein [Proteobacteria bacterium]|nr:metallophosphoesterase family protein [Pseudomonadota bacterium]